MVKKWIPVLLWCAVIFGLSAQPHLPGPEDETWNFIFKKLGHICAYGILFWLTYKAFGKETPQRALKSFLFCILYAISDEFHQSFVPGRTPMVRDIGIDVIGMTLSFYLSAKR